MRASPVDVSEQRFRDVLGHYCTGVTVITALDGNDPVGFSCQSFQSLSLDPPMVSFAPSLTSTTWPRIRRAGIFAANILAEDQGELCRTFAISGGDKFSGVTWTPGHGGAPLLDGSLATVECEITGEAEAGDHTIVLGHVHRLDVRPGRPLLFYQGRFESLSRTE
ncbi:Monooxygenase [Frankia canadensis]|uniref:Monooxygenase n=1 Tax=Frankia canadensis TaxID=1836972 RepID=A0A2I2KLV8_9ACTN|nr:flavin reductase family protein [Frankia canadensis]SNQ46626.1 Monooxygenase [Frankia canadensis]SOU53916.1 Monooxygenase [Frankia canadensis]